MSRGPAASATPNYKKEQLINLAAYREMMGVEREGETEENKRERVKRDVKKPGVQK